MSELEEELVSVFPEGVEYPDEQKVEGFSEQFLCQSCIEKAVKDNNPAMLAYGLFTKDGRPREGVEVSISRFLGKRKKEIKLDDHHNCLRLVLRYMKATGTDQLVKPDDSYYHPLRNLIDSSTAAQDLGVVIEEFGIENINFVGISFDYPSTGYPKYESKKDHPNYELLKSLMANYLKMKADGKENESLLKNIIYPMNHEYGLRRVVEDLPDLMQGAIAGAKEDLGPEREVDLNQAANTLEADILGELYKTQQKELKADLAIKIIMCLFVLPAFYFIPTFIIDYVRRPIGERDLSKKQANALQEHKKHKVDELHDDDAPYTETSTLSPVNKNNKLRPILVDLSKGNEEEAVEEKPKKKPQKQQLLYTKTKSGGKTDFFRGQRLMHKIRTEMKTLKPK